MPPKKTKRQLADEAWLRNQQVEMDAVATEQQRTVPHFEQAPADCPHCLKTMTPRSGWTLLFGDLLQCGGCAYTCSVPRAEFERVGEAIHRAHPHANGYTPPPKAKGPRVRGGG